MKKTLWDCLGKNPSLSESDTEPVKFTSDLVIQVDSEDTKDLSIKKSSKLKIFFFVLLKSKLESIKRYISDCFFFRKYSPLPPSTPLLLIID